MKKTKLLLVVIIMGLSLLLSSCALDFDFSIPELPPLGGSTDGETAGGNGEKPEGGGSNSDGDPTGGDEDEGEDGENEGGNTEGGNTGGGNSDGGNTEGGNSDGGNTESGSGNEGENNGEGDEPIDPKPPIDDEPQHVCVFGDWRVIEEPTCVKDGYRIRSCECNEEQSEVLPATGLHTEEIIPETETKTEWSKCSVCGVTLKAPEWKLDGKFTDPSAYDGDYGYNTLADMANGSALQSFYNAMDAVADKFHEGELTADPSNLVFAEVNFNELGLSTDEACAVWAVYRADRPLYFWLDSGVELTSKNLYLKANELYLDKEVRDSYTEKIYLACESYVNTTASHDSIYEITLSLHDSIIKNIDYAYDSNGSPESAAWAHNVLGVFVNESAVCEGYAKAFHLLLNFLGVENAYATGASRGVGHAWNIVKLDDGEWYWYDLTWDDQPDWIWGVTHNYFAVSATDNTKWQDGIYEQEFGSFLSDHTVSESDITAKLNYQYPLPTPAADSFTASELIVRRTTFTVDGSTFVFCGDGEVALTSVVNGGVLDIPETVTYNGRSFKVSVIGRFSEGVFLSDTIGYNKMELTKVNIPSSVKYVFYGAFNFIYLEAVTVDADNLSYSSDGGILYSKDYTSIEWIPQGIRGEVVIRNEVTNFERLRFTYAYNVTSVTLPSTVTEIPANCFMGCDKLYKVTVNVTEAQWDLIVKGSDWAKESEFILYLLDSNKVIKNET